MTRPPSLSPSTTVIHSYYISISIVPIPFAISNPKSSPTPPPITSTCHSLCTFPFHQLPIIPIQKLKIANEALYNENVELRSLLYRVNGFYKDDDKKATHPTLQRQETVANLQMVMKDGRRIMTDLKLKAFLPHNMQQ